MEQWYLDEIFRCLDRNGKYTIINDFSDSGFIKHLEERGLEAKGIFRDFPTVDICRGRSLNKQFNSDFNFYRDSLMDYPTIIKSKLGKNWEAYNLMATLHAPFCNSNCWHCYVDNELKDVRADILRTKRVPPRSGLYTSDQVYEEFSEFQEYKKNNEKEVNVLRVSGGEPLFLCNLILELLQKIKDEKEDKNIFVWTETNLFPLMNIGNNTALVESWSPDFFQNLSEYSNFALHPCIHGITCENMRYITKIQFESEFNYEEFLRFAFRKLIENKIDIYPTFGSNISPPDKIEYIFNLLKSINKNLPLRFALIDYQVDYSAIIERIDRNFQQTIREMEVYNKALVLYKWNKLIQQNYSKNHPNIEYTSILRHNIPL